MATEPPAPYRRLKRLLDLAAAGPLLVAALPLLLGLMLAIRLDSPGPALFVQTRVGYRGRRFRMFKLRTMAVNAEQRLPSLRQPGDGPVFKLADDPRVTRVGRWLRRASLDELPQLLNVLRGEMSLVGPRPLPPDQVDPADPRFIRRTLALPGLSGLWQVQGRAMHFDYDRWLTMDLTYVEQCSLTLDLAIAARTPAAVWRGEGAC